jgi:hypothetical protein
VSEAQNTPPLPPWVGREGFITAEEWLSFDEGTRSWWLKFAGDVTWLLDQPPFRRFAFAFLNEPRFCGTDQSPVRHSTEETFRAIGIQDAGRALRLVLQTVAPRMWMKTMHEAFNAVNSSNTPPESGKR